LSILTFSHADNYPSTYPFEFEEEFPVGAPSFAYDETDPGGYFRLMMDANLEDDFYAQKIDRGTLLIYFDTQAYWYRFHVTDQWYGYTPDDSPGFIVNCSGANAATPQMVTDANNDNTYKCDNFLGTKPLFIEPYTAWEPFVLGASCPDPQEEVVCLINFYGLIWCWQYVESFSGRSAILPCMDTLFHWYKTCVTLIDPIDMTNYDTILYRENLTPYQSWILRGFEYNPDRVCHNYEYYHPSASDAPSSTGSPENEEDSSEVSSYLFINNFLQIMGVLFGSLH